MLSAWYLRMNELKKLIRPSTRFEFGNNWERFLDVVDEERITTATKSLQGMLETPSLENKKILDVGSGSGLFSLAARNLGGKVHSFDYDQQSVACTESLKQHYFPEDDGWIIERGSILDTEYLENLDKFDIVYAWGVLHHTGNLWSALENVSNLVIPGGKLFISIYNDAGYRSKAWKYIKRIYNNLPLIRPLLLGYGLLRIWGLKMARDTLQGQPLKTWHAYGRTSRGMSAWRDVIDWVGGYPYEFAKPEEIFEFFYKRGFELQKLKTMRGGLGCNEFIFSRKNKSIT